MHENLYYQHRCQREQNGHLCVGSMGVASVSSSIISLNYYLKEKARHYQHS